jgi:DNA (cytosine-5)-methyltransferase 1
MKILNLYAGVGGNRRLWGDEHEITAIEYSQDIADVYKDLYPNDNVIVDDAHDYLLNHFKEFDFIWSSPPCQSHSRIRQYIGVGSMGVKPVYPDMKLYQEIIFLQANFKGLWIVENVKPYYEPLIKPTSTLHRHLIWSNFEIANKSFHKFHLVNSAVNEIEAIYQIDLSKYKLKNKRQILRNCVNPEMGLHVLQHALNHAQS